MLRRFLPALVLALLVFLGWLVLPNARRQQTVADQLTKAAETHSPTQKTQAPASPPTLAFPLNAAGTDIQADLRLLSATVETFRTNFPQEGNPTGSNAEITAALAGKNKVGFAFIPPNHPAINRAGELCDRWGTPFFFHAESATRMEVRSAGPDRKFWTSDDIAYAP
jgi:hypothetical protein